MSLNEKPTFKPADFFLSLLPAPFSTEGYFFGTPKGGGIAGGTFWESSPVSSAISSTSFIVNDLGCSTT